MAKPVFRGSRKNWHLGFKMDKMVKRGKLSIHLQKASQLSKEWGEGQWWFPLEFQIEQTGYQAGGCGCGCTQADTFFTFTVAQF